MVNTVSGVSLLKKYVESDRSCSPDMVNMAYIADI